MRKIVVAICFFFLSFSHLWAEIYISEVLPNTIDDKSLEYISIRNISENTINLEGFSLNDASGKTYIFGDEQLSPQSEKKFYRTQTKIILNNSNETLELISSEGDVIDSVEYKTSNKGEAVVFQYDGEVQQGELAGEEDTGEQQEEGEEIIEEFTLRMNLQRPSYVTQSGSSDTYICDNSKQECKVNLNFSESFSGIFKSSEYECRIDFGLGELTGEEEKCNPNTVVFPQGETPVIVSVSKKDSGELFYEKQYNFIYDTSLSTLSNTREQHARLYIPKPRIVIQSGLERSGNNFYCKKQPCKINLNYEQISKEEGCYWNFGPGKASSKTTKKRCNPGYVEIPEGVFELQLKVYEKDFPSNKKVTRFFIHNTPKEVENEYVDESKEEIVSDTTVELETQKGEENIAFPMSYPEFEITLQGKISKEKKYSGSKLECVDVEKCYVNLGLSSSGSLKENIIVWKLNEEVFYTGENPKGFWLETGNYNITAEIIAENKTVYQQNFQIVIPVMQKEKKQEKVAVMEPLLFTEVVTDEPDDSKEIQKIFTQNYLPLKYDGLRISGKAPIGSLVKIFHNNRVVGEATTSEKGRYRMVTKNIVPGEYSFSSHIVLDDGSHIQLEKSGTTIIEAGDMTYWYTQKKKSSAKSKKTPLLTLEEKTSDSAGDIGGEEKISFSRHIWMMICITIVGIFLLGHILWEKFSFRKDRFYMHKYLLEYKTRQRVSVILL